MAAQATDQATETATDEIARTRDGTRISYRLVPGSKEHRFVLIHSLAMDKSFWDRVVPKLVGAGEILVLDCRGHGQSDKPAGPYSIAQFGDDIADVMDHVGWRSAIVAGASMGGCVTLAFAARHPERVAGLGLFDTTAWYGETAPEDWQSAPPKPRAKDWPRSWHSSKRAGSAMNSGRPILTSSRKPCRFFSPTICPLTLPPATCSGPPICEAPSHRSIFPARSASALRTTRRRQRWQNISPAPFPGHISKSCRIVGISRRSKHRTGSPRPFGCLQDADSAPLADPWLARRSGHG